MNDSSASAKSATASSNSKKASQDAGTMLFITSPPFVDQVRLVTGLFSGKDAMDWNARRRQRTLLRAPDGGLHITPDGGTWQRHDMRPGPAGKVFSAPDPSDRPFDHRPQLRRHLRLDAEPRLPGRPALIQQHAQAVDGPVAALAGRGEKRRLERDVNDVGSERGLRQLVQTDVEQGLADHAAAGGVDHHRRAFQSVVALFPGQGLDRSTELVGNSFCAGERAVEEANLLRTLPREAVAHGS